MDSLGSRIRDYRKKNKLTQVRLAEIIGVSGNAISSWELDANIPEKKHIDALSECFNVLPQELQYGSLPVVVHHAPEGTVNIPIKEYIDYLKYKASASCGS